MNLSYKFYFKHSSLSASPKIGLSRGFEELWQAQQYLDEEREHAQAAADESGATQVLRVVSGTRDRQNIYSRGPKYFYPTLYVEYIHPSEGSPSPLVFEVDGEMKELPEIDSETREYIHAAYWLELAAYSASLVKFSREAV